MHRSNDTSAVRAAWHAWHAFLAAASVAVLGGCALGPELVRTEVTSFNEWSTMPADRTYTFARTLEYQNSPELQSYENLVRDELGPRGFRLVPDPAQANLVVTLRPSISHAAVRIADPWPFDPYFGRSAYFGLRGYGWGWPYWGYGWGYGGFFNDFHDDSVEIFQRRLELDIDSRETAGKRYYEGRVENVGRSNALPRIMPVLVRALFADFPGNNGQTRRVDVPVARGTAGPQ